MGSCEMGKALSTLR